MGKWNYNEIQFAGNSILKLLCNVLGDFKFPFIFFFFLKY